MSKVLKALMIAWLAPVTAIALVYVGLFSLLKWYKLLGVRGDALVWLTNPDKMPAWLSRAWSGWGGQTIGNVVVMKGDPDANAGDAVILRHEQEHVRQGMVLGIFQPIFYAMMWLIIKLGCRNSQAYWDNVLERDARRAAGQEAPAPKLG